MKVYRIENADREGPFSGSPALYNLLVQAYGKGPNHGGATRADEMDPRRMPSGSYGGNHAKPFEILRCSERKKIRFGWATKAQMRRWFRPALMRALARHGYRLSVYDVPQAWVSDSQCTFLWDEARLVREEPLHSSCPPLSN